MKEPREYEIRPAKIPGLDWMSAKRWRRRDELALAFGVHVRSIKRWVRVMGWKTAGSMVSMADVVGYFYQDYKDQVLIFWEKRSGF